MFFQTSLLTVTVDNPAVLEGAEGTQAGTEINATIDPVTGQIVDQNGNPIEGLEATTSSTGEVPQEPATMSPAVGALYVFYAIFCVALIALIISQKKRSASFGNGMGGGSETYWDKNKGRSMEGKLDLYTKWGIGIFMVLTFIITLI